MTNAVEQNDSSTAVAVPFEAGQADDSRIIKYTTTGCVQAWAAHPNDVAVNFSLYANVQHQATKAAYVSQSLNMTVADARDLAQVLIEAADHADAVRVAEASDLGIAA